MGLKRKAKLWRGPTSLKLAYANFVSTKNNFWPKIFVQTKQLLCVATKVAATVRFSKYKPIVEVIN